MIHAHMGCWDFLLCWNKTLRLESPPGGHQGLYSELQNHLLNNTVTHVQCFQQTVHKSITTIIQVLINGDC